MFTSRVPKIGSSTWLRVVPFLKYSTTTQNSMNIESQPQLPPKAKPKRQRKPRGMTDEAHAALKDSKSLSSNNTPAFEDVRSVVKTMEAVSIVNTGNSTLDSTSEITLRLKAFEQSLSQPFMHHTPQQISTPKSKSRPLRHHDEKVDPSPASGGIPNPSLDYIRACTFGPSLLKDPQHLLVVIDLNGTLLYRPDKKNPTKFHMRPHAQTFLKYCVDTFTVVIWSSARPANVKAMCNTILTPDIRNKVAAIWGRDTFGLTQADYEQRTQCYKRLTKIWQDPKITVRHPAFYEGHRWDQTNTVLIDDSREKARSEPHNLIEVPEYFGDVLERDDILPQVHDYLNHLSMHSNVSACLQSHPWKPSVYMDNTTC
jgi:hypothetical protein